MATNPAEVTLTSPRSALAQRVLAGLVLAAIVGGMAVLAFSDQPWWGIVLEELALLVLVFIVLAIWVTAGDSAEKTVALRAAGTEVLGEIIEKTESDDGDDVYYELTIRIPLPDGDFEGRHRCRRSGCAARRPGGQIPLLVASRLRLWAVVH
ncbi:hypothetical protein ACFOWZ_16650 [Lentzea rhizosphaerae]|uniref:Uncharacterized protein n=1 Tax=Lentzea rhizosphaerae TaxID=2041025 RepID=A0ABV8BT89_9PSEU